MNIDVKYKSTKRYNTAKYPIRQPKFFVGLIWLLSKIMLLDKKYKVEKINMEGLKPPYMILSNHMSFIDFELVAMGTFPHRVNNVVNIDGYYMRPWLMELIGAICTRKFTMDMHLIRSIRKVLKRGDVLCMYPEARYSPCGIESYIPDSVGMLVKSNKVPVVAVVHRGNYLHSPFWNFRKKRKAQHHTTMTKILTVDDIQKMSVDEINDTIRKALTYNEYQYQKDSGILIKEKYRAEGLHKILYHCPACKTESKMDSKGAEIFCRHCGKRWVQNEDGILKALNGETEFANIPDWFRWERKMVEKQIESGEYKFDDEVDVYSMPRCWRFEPLGKARLTHDYENGFILEGEYNNQKYRIHRMPLQTNSLHVEYDFQHVKPFDCVDISTENDSFYCYPMTKENVLTKMAFATEIIYEKHLSQKRANHNKNLK
ncbi:MAG: 1-acyl-sn-glycerol-3-phosphate acyltransferase [Ruminococcaceae bacterium]|nr:1-acyl-sn-glycerol-3-phosphate acyltransferase [Oscillospiraceae bacterium]